MRTEPQENKKKRSTPKQSDLVARLFGVEIMQESEEEERIGTCRWWSLRRAIFKKLSIFASKRREQLSASTDSPSQQPKKDSSSAAATVAASSRTGAATQRKSGLGELLDSSQLGLCDLCRADRDLHFRFLPVISTHHHHHHHHISLPSLGWHWILLFLLLHLFFAFGVIFDLRIVQASFSALTDVSFRSV